MLTGNFEKPVYFKVPMLEKNRTTRTEHGELAAKEYVSS
jgi:hypothetical protein